MDTCTVCVWVGVYQGMEGRDREDAQASHGQLRGP